MFNYTEIDPEICEFFVVGDVSELPAGERLFVQIKGEDIVLINLGASIYAIADVCSHDDGPLGDGDIEGQEIICPRHGAKFDLRTGKALTLPAVEDIPAYPVRIVDGKIQVGLPKQGD